MNIYNIEVVELGLGAQVKFYTTEAKTIRGAVANLRRYLGIKFIKYSTGTYYDTDIRVQAHIIKSTHIIGDRI